MARRYYDFRTPLVELAGGLVTDIWQQWLNLIFGDITELQNAVLGVHMGPLGTEPTDLNAENEDYLFTVTAPYYHTVRWTGSAWDWFDGDRPGIFKHTAQDPGAGYQLCDGSATTFLTVGVTLGTSAFTTPNLSGSPAYLKTAAAYTGAVEAAVGPGLSGNTGSESSHTHGVSITTGDCSASFSNVTFTGSADVTVAHQHHTHDVVGTTAAGSAHSHGVGSLAADATGDPQHVNVLAYVRR